MDKLEYSETFIKKAQERLREIAQGNLSEIPYGEPFSNFSVVTGETDKLVVVVVDVPEDLREKIGDKAYVVTN